MYQFMYECLLLHEFQMHLLIPAIMSCTVTRQLCSFPAAQNHWALREYTSSIIQKLVNNFYIRDSSILPRIIRFVCRKLVPCSLMIQVYYFAEFTRRVFHRHI